MGKLGQSLTRDTQFETDLKEKDADFRKAFSQSKHIELGYDLFVDGAPRIVDYQWGDLAALFPEALAVELFSPFLVVRFNELPPKPRPLTIGKLPVHFTTSTKPNVHYLGKIGKGAGILTELDLRLQEQITDALLRTATNVLVDAIGNIFDIFWWGGAWAVTVPDETDLANLPRTLCQCWLFFKRKMDQPPPSMQALRTKALAGVDYDDSQHDQGYKPLLRPGIMLSSSAWHGEDQGTNQKVFNSTSSGVAVVDSQGNKFITATARGFDKDHEVWHPKPDSGHRIGRTLEDLSDTDIAIVELNDGLKYDNKTFGNEYEPEGVELTGIVPANMTKRYSRVFMDNAFSGRCEGLVVALGLTVPDFRTRKFISHRWIYFENGDAPIDGSCGAPIWNQDGKLEGFFRFSRKDEIPLGLAVNAHHLEEHGYRLSIEDSSSK